LNIFQNSGNHSKSQREISMVITKNGRFQKYYTMNVRFKQLS